MNITDFTYLKFKKYMKISIFSCIYTMVLIFLVFLSLFMPGKVAKIQVRIYCNMHEIL